MKNKAEKCNRLTDYIPLLFYCLIYSLSFALTILRIEKRKRENFSLFIFFLSFSCQCMHNLKTIYGVSYNLHAPNQTTSPLYGIFLFWFGGGGVQAITAW